MANGLVTGFGEGAGPVRHGGERPGADAGGALAVTPAAAPSAGHGDGLDGFRAIDGLRAVMEEGTAPNTRRAYRSDMRFFGAWCSARGFDDAVPVTRERLALFVLDCSRGMPAGVEAAMLASGAKRTAGPSAPSTVSRRVAALSVAHDLAGCPDNPCLDPRVRKLMGKAKAAKVRAGWAPSRKSAAHREVLEAMLATCASDDLRDVRDRALLLFGFSSGGRRRSEVVGMAVDRLERVGADWLYRLGATKTSQDGDTGAVPVAGVAARALDAWLERSGVSGGAVFRSVDRHGVVGDRGLSDRTVARVVQRRASLAGLDASAFAGHSLRSGFMTEAGMRDMSIAEAMALSMHRNVQVAMGYYQAGNALRNRTARLMD